MTATILATGPSTQASESLTYTPPAGSELVGGTVQDTFSADGHSQASPDNSSGAAGVLAPDGLMHPADELTACADWSGGCWHLSSAPFQSQPDWSGTTTIPSGIGGTLTVMAACLVLSSGGQCDSTSVQS